MGVTISPATNLSTLRRVLVALLRRLPDGRPQRSSARSRRCSTRPCSRTPPGSRRRPRASRRGALGGRDRRRHGVRPLERRAAADSTRFAATARRASRCGSSRRRTRTAPSSARSTSWSGSAPRSRSPTTRRRRGSTPRPGSSTARAATRPPTSARRTSRTRRRCSGSNGTSASRASATRTPSPRWRRSSRATGRAATSSRTTPTSSARRTEAATADGPHAAQPDRDRTPPVPGGAARAGRGRPPSGPPPQPARRRNRHGQDRDGGGRLRAPSRRAAAQPPAVRRSPRGDPRPEPGDVPARAARRSLRREVGRRPAARAVRARLRVDPEPEQRRTSGTSTRRISTSSSSTSSTTPPRRRTRRCSTTSTPVELLGLTATPERADGLDVLRYFDGRIAAELRLWDAIDQQYLAPFAYFGVHDGLDLRGVPWRRGQGYDVTALDQRPDRRPRLGARVIEQVRRKVADPPRCGPSASASASATPASWPSGSRLGLPPWRSRRRQPLGRAKALHCAISTRGRSASRLHGRPVQRGRRRPERRHAAAAAADREPDALPPAARPRPAEGRGKGGLHGARLRRHPPQGVPVRSALARAARRLAHGRRAPGSATTSRSCPPAATSNWIRWRGTSCCEASARRSRARGASECARAALARRRHSRRRTSRAPVSNSRTSTRAVTAGRRCAARPACRPRRRAREERCCCGRSGGCSTSTTTSASTRTARSSRRRPPADPRRLSPRERAAAAHARLARSRRLRHVGELRRRGRRSSGTHPQVRAELVEVLDLLRERVDHLRPPARASGRAAPVHARYTRTEILAAFGVGEGASRRPGRRVSGGSRTVADRPLRLHARQERRRLLADHPLPRLRDQPGPDPLGEPVRDRRRQRHRAGATSVSATSRNERRAVRPAANRPTGRSGASARATT